MPSTLDASATLNVLADDAAAETDSSPSDAQKSAGNYRKGKFRWHGLEISIENPRGSIRSGKDRSGNAWEVEMPYHYGYIQQTESEADGDHIDVFLGPDLDSELVFVVDQQKPSGRFDEHKCMLGWRSVDEAQKAYLAAYSPGWKGLAAITPMTLPQFLGWLENGDSSKPVDRHSLRSATSQPDRYRVTHAPKGGIALAGKQFVGGQFIPSEDIASASPQERKALAVATGQTADLPQRHASTGSAFASVTHGPTAGLMRALHSSKEHQETGMTATKSVNPKHAGDVYDFMRANVGKSTGGGHVVDLGGGRLGFASKAGAIVVAPAKGGKWHVSYTTQTKMVDASMKGGGGKGGKGGPKPNDGDGGDDSGPPKPAPKQPGGAPASPWSNTPPKVAGGDKGHPGSTASTKTHVPAATPKPTTPKSSEVPSAQTPAAQQPENVWQEIKGAAKGVAGAFRQALAPTDREKQWAGKVAKAIMPGKKPGATQTPPGKTNQGVRSADLGPFRDAGVNFSDTPQPQQSASETPRSPSAATHLAEPPPVTTAHKLSVAREAHQYHAGQVYQHKAALNEAMRQRDLATAKGDKEGAKKARESIANAKAHLRHHRDQMGEHKRAVGEHERTLKGEQRGQEQQTKAQQRETEKATKESEKANKAKQREAEKAARVHAKAQEKLAEVNARLKGLSTGDKMAVARGGKPAAKAAPSPIADGHAMTRAEFTAKGGKVGQHKTAVKQALAAGQQVPAHVLAEYPELTQPKRQAPKPEPTLPLSGEAQLGDRLPGETDKAPENAGSAGRKVQWRVPTPEELSTRVHGHLVAGGLRDTPQNRQTLQEALAKGWLSHPGHLASVIAEAKKIHSKGNLAEDDNAALRQALNNRENRSQAHLDQFKPMLASKAAEHEVDPKQLEEAIDSVLEAKKQDQQDRELALADVRKRLGLNRNQISERDHASVPRFDDFARDVAGEYPELGIGQGYEGGGHNEDAAGALWELLNRDAPTPLVRHDPDLMDEAAAWLKSQTKTGLSPEELRELETTPFARERSAVDRYWRWRAVARYDRQRGLFDESEHPRDESGRFSHADKLGAMMKKAGHKLVNWDHVQAAGIPEELSPTEAHKALTAAGVDDFQADFHVGELQDSPHAKSRTKLSTKSIILRGRSAIVEAHEQDAIDKNLEAAKGADVVVLRDAQEPESEFIAHRSVQAKGKWQLTRLTSHGERRHWPLSHSEHDSMEEAIKSATSFRGEGSPHYEVIFAHKQGDSGPMPFAMDRSGVVRHTPS